MAKVADNKITISSFEQVMKDDFPKQKTKLEWHGLEVYVENTISFGKMLTIVQDVADFCFADGSGEYIPQVKQFALRCGVIEYYTNIKLPDDLTRRYDMVYGTDIFEAVLPYINDVQLGDISSAIDEKVHQAASIGISNIHNEVNKLIANFTEMQEKLEGAMGDITPNMVEEFMSIIKGDNSEATSEEE